MAANTEVDDFADLFDDYEKPSPKVIESDEIWLHFFKSDLFQLDIDAAINLFDITDDESNQIIDPLVDEEYQKAVFSDTFYDQYKKFTNSFMQKYEIKDASDVINCIKAGKCELEKQRIDIDITFPANSTLPGNKFPNINKDFHSFYLFLKPSAYINLCKILGTVRERIICQN